MSLYYTALSQFILIAAASPIGLNVVTYRSTLGISQNNFEANVIKDASIFPNINFANYGSLCKLTANCGAFALVDGACKLANAAKMVNDGNGDMKSVFVDMAQTHIVYATGVTLAAATTTTTSTTATTTATTTTQAPVPCPWLDDSDGLIETGVTDTLAGSNGGFTEETCVQACVNMNDGRNGATLYQPTGDCYCFKGVKNTKTSTNYKFRFIGYVGSEC